MVFLLFYILANLCSDYDEFREINNSDFASAQTILNFSRPIVFLIHGYDSSYLEWSNETAKTWIQMRDSNVCCVDWSPWAHCNFLVTILINARLTAQYVASFINYLVQNNYTDHSKISMVGHSVGAHIMGDVGKLMQQNKIPLCYGD